MMFEFENPRYQPTHTIEESMIEIEQLGPGGSTSGGGSLAINVKEVAPEEVEEILAGETCVCYGIILVYLCVY